MSLEATFDLANAWLRECLSTHSICDKTVAVSNVSSLGSGIHIVRDIDHHDRMPRRLLSIQGTLEDFPNVTVKLVEIEKGAAELEYLALSHRWGQNEGFKATRALVAQFAQGIPIAGFPKTFAEAIKVTLALGYAHLWIDSLCIVQDDPDDWKNEAPRMAIVYGNARCCIVAMDGAGSSSGLLGLSPEEVAEKPLTSRAWVVQERMLPSRSLVFNQDGVSWECRQGDATQQQPDLIPRSPTDDNPKKLYRDLADFNIPGQTRHAEAYPTATQDIDADEVSSLNVDRYLPFLKHWWSFLSTYTQCDLSHESDKFLAMNGIASSTQRNTGLRSTWGLWTSFLFTELMWYIDTEGPVSARPGKWLAPTWSWGSTVGGRVRNGFYDRETKSFIMAKPVVVGAVVTGFDQALPIEAWKPLRHRCLELKGDLRSTTITTIPNSDGGKRYSARVDKKGRWSEEEKHTFYPDVPLEVGVMDVQAFLLFHYEKDEVDGEYRNIRLVLVAQGNPEVRRFKRIGYLETTYAVMRQYETEIFEDIWWTGIQLI